MDDAYIVLRLPNAREIQFGRNSSVVIGLLVRLEIIYPGKNEFFYTPIHTPVIIRRRNESDIIVEKGKSIICDRSPSIFLTRLPLEQNQVPDRLARSFIETPISYIVSIV